MPRSPTMKLSFTLMVLGLLAIGIGIFLLTATPTMAQDEGNVVRGGLLYDTWWAVLNDEMEMTGGEEHEHEHNHEDEMAGAPEDTQPLWSTQSNNDLTGGETWSCSLCHGFDYLGADGAFGPDSEDYTGFTGVMQSTGKPPADIVVILKGGTNPDHDFSMYLSDTDLLDLATFISKGLIDTTQFINADGTSTGDATNGKSHFEQVCIFCHGPEGNAINFHGIDDPEFVGHVATNEPEVLMHKVRFGQPGWPMPSGINNGWSDSDVADVLAYVQTLPTEPKLSGGGQLYDNWAVALEIDAPESDQPLWKGQDPELSGGDTWTCVGCHGFDYKGSEDVPGVLDAATMSSDDLVAWLDGTKNSDHVFSQYMDETAMNAMVTFMQTEMVDPSQYINEDGTSTGDPRFGRDLFNGTCALCHGTDGRTHNFHSADDPEYIGTLAVNDPYEFFSKASFGNPGIPMPAGRALGWEPQDIADLLAYAQTLPTK